MREQRSTPISRISTVRVDATASAPTSVILTVRVHLAVLQGSTFKGRLVKTAFLTVFSAYRPQAIASTVLQDTHFQGQVATSAGMASSFPQRKSVMTAIRTQMTAAVDLVPSKTVTHALRTRQVCALLDVATP